MKIAFFDCFSGIAGDMALGALLDAGADLETLKRDLASLAVENWEIRVENVLRSGIHARSVSISHQGQTDEEELAHARAHEHHHEHHHHHEHEHSGAHQHFHGRSMAQIREIIEASELSARVKRDSLKIFEKIAVAEAFLHHSTPEAVHFHEIGGLDSLLDIVGVAWCLENLGIDEIYCSALPLSSGWVDCAHGKMPVPAPATLEITKGMPWISTEMRGELVTPTGAAIVAALASSLGAAPTMTLQNIGLGAGKKDFPNHPNITRVSIGESEDLASNDGLEWRELNLWEANVDDMNPEMWELATERIFAAGALDVWISPISMKKGRPAQLLSALCDFQNEKAVLGAILRETTSLGARRTSVSRAALPREFASVETSFGAVNLKIARWQEGRIERAIPEWEDVKRLAAQNNVAAREVYQAALRAFEN